MKKVQKCLVFVCAFLLMSFTGTFKKANAEDIIIPFFNGGFEMGDFSGWAHGSNVPGLDLWFVSPAYDSPFFPIGPIEGMFDAVNGFDGVGNLRMINVQDPQGEYYGMYEYDDLYHIVSESGVVEHSGFYTL